MLENSSIKRVTALECSVPNYLIVKIETDDGAQYAAEGKTTIALSHGKIYMCGTYGKPYGNEGTINRMLVALFALTHEGNFLYKEDQTIPLLTPEEIDVVYACYRIGRWEDRFSECPWIYAKEQGVGDCGNAIRVKTKEDISRYIEKLAEQAGIGIQDRKSR